MLQMYYSYMFSCLDLWCHVAGVYILKCMCFVLLSEYNTEIVEYIIKQNDIFCSSIRGSTESQMLLIYWIDNV